MTRRNLILAIAGGLLAALAFPNPWYIGLTWGGGFLGWVCLIPLFAIRESRGGKHSAAWGFLFGFVFFGLSIIWMAGMRSMHPLGPMAWALLTAYLALFPALFLVGYHFLLSRGLAPWSAAAALWVGLEFLRNHFLSGFPWVSLGYAHYQNPLMLALAPVTGVWGVSLLAVLVNYGLYSLLKRIWPAAGGQEICCPAAPEPAGTRRLRWLLSGLLGAFILGGMGYAQYQLRVHPGSRPVIVSALQGNIDQNQAWDLAYQRSTLETYRNLAQAAREAGARLVVWPETAFPGVFNMDKTMADTVRQWSWEGRLAQVVGSDEVIKDDRLGYLYYNSLFLLDQDGKSTGSTSKKHLVPFGEYVPYKDSLLFFIHKIVTRYGGAGFTPAPERRLLPWQEENRRIPIGALVCFESIFPGYAARLSRRGAELLVVVTNDTWFGNSAAPAQHAGFSAFRAAETGRYLVRAASTGISAVYDPRGRLLASQPLNTQGHLTVPVRPRKILTPFTRLGNWICWICVFVILFDFLPAICMKITRFLRRGAKK